MNSRYEGKQSNSTRNMKHINCVPKDVQIIISSRKSLMNRKRSTKKLFLKVLQYSQENSYVGISFLIKMQVFRASALLEETQTQVFFAYIEKFLRTPILKNISKMLLLRFSLEFFPIWTSNLGSEEDVFWKIKQNKNRSKTHLYEKKTCLFMMFFILSFFSFYPLHVRWHLPYIITKQFWNSLTNEQLILDQWKN